MVSLYNHSNQVPDFFNVCSFLLVVMVMVDSDCTTNDHTAALQCTGVPPLNNDIEKDYAKVVQDACRYVKVLL